MRVAADRGMCVSAGLCVVLAEQVFDQDDDGVVVVLADQIPEGAEQRVREAVQVCPSGALRVLG